MKNKSAWAWGARGLALLGIFGLYWSHKEAKDPGMRVPAPSHAKALRIGDAAPEFSGIDVRMPHSGATLSLSQFRGKRVILNFWATWCEACKREKPIMVQLSQQTDAVVVGIAVNDDKNKVIERERLDPHGYPLILDEDGSISSHYGVDALPQTILINEQGKVSYRVRGIISKSDLKSSGIM